MTGRPLDGRRVATTRDEPGRLDSLLAGLGADVVHVPLIEIADPPDPDLARAREHIDEHLDRYDWVVVTSKHGARRVADAVTRHPGVALAAVGTATADILAAAGRPVDVVPARQTAADLVAAMPSPPASGARVLVAQADRADTTLVDGLRALGYVVDAVVAYTTRLRAPTAAERRALERADAVAFASGSAATAWAEAVGSWTPPCVVAIGPSTASAASAAGLQISAVAADHSVEGLADAIVAATRDLP